MAPILQVFECGSSAQLVIPAWAVTAALEEAFLIVFAVCFFPSCAGYHEVARPFLLLLELVLIVLDLLPLLILRGRNTALATLATFLMLL